MQTWLCCYSSLCYWKATLLLVLLLMFSDLNKVMVGQKKVSESYLETRTLVLCLGSFELDQQASLNTSASALRQQTQITQSTTRSSFRICSFCLQCQCTSCVILLQIVLLKLWLNKHYTTVMPTKALCWTVTPAMHVINEHWECCGDDLLKWAELELSGD